MSNSIVFELVIFLLTSFKAWQHWRTDVNIPILMVLYRDGASLPHRHATGLTMYRLCILFCDMLWVRPTVCRCLLSHDRSVAYEPLHLAVGLCMSFSCPQLSHPVAEGLQRSLAILFK